MIYLLKNILFTIFAGVLLSLSLPAEIWAQLANTSDDPRGLRGAPRVYKFGARTAALGDATVADIRDLSAINMNPAALSFVSDINSVQVNTIQNWNNNLMLENLTFPVFKYAKHTIAAQLGFHHRGLELTNILGTTPLPQPNMLMYQFDLAYSISFQDVLSFGVFNNISFAQNEIAQYWTYYPILGLLYAPSHSISYGIVFRGLGRSVTYLFPDNRTTALGSQNLRESLELGATLQLPVDLKATSFAIYFANEKRFGQDGLWYKAGLEIDRLSYLSLRGGIILQPETNIYAPRFGIGIVTNMVELNYAISYDKRLYERFHQLGLTLHLD